jgi:glycosyltransferase involved in cell wall biosynthesis
MGDSHHSTGLRLSVVVPAHNEANVVASTLGRLCGREDDDLEIVVVCNGCTDATAEIARETAQGDALVIETPVASKSAALNLGDDSVTTFPRLYLDADVSLDADAARHLADALEPPVLAAAPARHLDTGRSPWLVRSYLRYWSELPSVRSSLAGRGAIAVSEEGRRRFGRFPELVADDRFLDSRFSADEVRIVPEVTSIVAAPGTIGDLLARRTRVFLGNRQLAAAGASRRTAERRTGWIEVLVRSPVRLLDLPAYLIVTLAAELRSRRRYRRQDFSWDRDESTRAADHG